MESPPQWAIPGNGHGPLAAAAIIGDHSGDRSGRSPLPPGSSFLGPAGISAPIHAGWQCGRGSCYTARMQQPYDISRVIRAIEFAAKKHRMQRRKDSDASPYINHPIALMHVLCIDGGIRDPRILAAAALHDTIEDTETTPSELVAEFGADVADLVVEMTDDKSLPKMERKRLQIEHARHMSRDGALVKLADKICNLRDMAASPPENWSLEQRIEYFDWAKAVVDGLPRVNSRLLKMFEQAYAKRPTGMN
jgi:GTP diphosphokinase / guanosine-3',5'-bis(diphosphate) 3'-diphosphatase